MARPKKTIIPTIACGSWRKRRATVASWPRASPAMPCSSGVVETGGGGATLARVCMPASVVPTRPATLLAREVRRCQSYRILGSRKA